MANNRMYLRCGECGEAILLAKHSGDAWSLRAYRDGMAFAAGDGVLELQLATWLYDHYLCGGGDTHYTISYEHASGAEAYDRTITDPPVSGRIGMERARRAAKAVRKS